MFECWELTFVHALSQILLDNYEKWEMIIIMKLIIINY